MGKTTLRPGGIDATAWLIEQADIGTDTKILEVACNMGRTMIQLCQRFNCNMTGIDLDRQALEHAWTNIQKHHLESKLTLVHGNAMALPFEDNCFDVLINEAMLTMLTGDNKDKALKEYHRVLKPGGLLLTHDVVLFCDDVQIQKELQRGLSQAIHLRVEPLSAEGWKQVLENNHFHVQQKQGDMTLMKPSGMIHDEGFLRTCKIVKNALK